MKNKTMFEYVAIVFVAALLATVATVPFRYEAAQNATSSQTNKQTNKHKQTNKQTRV